MASDVMTMIATSPRPGVRPRSGSQQSVTSNVSNSSRSSNHVSPTTSVTTTTTTTSVRRSLNVQVSNSSSSFDKNLGVVTNPSTGSPVGLSPSNTHLLRRLSTTTTVRTNSTINLITGGGSPHHGHGSPSSGTVRRSSRVSFGSVSSLVGLNNANGGSLSDILGPAAAAAAATGGFGFTAGGIRRNSRGVPMIKVTATGTEWVGVWHQYLAQAFPDSLAFLNKIHQGKIKQKLPIQEASLKKWSLDEQLLLDRKHVEEIELLWSEYDVEQANELELTDLHRLVVDYFLTSKGYVMIWFAEGVTRNLMSLKHSSQIPEPPPAPPLPDFLSADFDSDDSSSTSSRASTRPSTAETTSDSKKDETSKITAAAAASDAPIITDLDAEPPPPTSRPSTTASSRGASWSRPSSSATRPRTPAAAAATVGIMAAMASPLAIRPRTPARSSGTAATTTGSTTKPRTPRTPRTPAARPLSTPATRPPSVSTGTPSSSAASPLPPPLSTNANLDTGDGEEELDAEVDLNDPGIQQWIQQFTSKMLSLASDLLDNIASNSEALAETMLQECDTNDTGRMVHV